MLNKIWFWAAAFWTVFVTIICLITFPEVPEVTVENADKYVHATIHFIFSIFWALHFQSKARWSSSKILMVVFTMSAFFGILLEIAQNLLTETRSADIRDIAANCAGALIALISIVLFDSARGRSLN